jgi:hypothetical protein
VTTISSLTTQALAGLTGSVGAPGLLTSPQKQAASSVSAAFVVTVSLSDAAKNALAPNISAPLSAIDAASKSVDSLLASNGSAIYTAAISSLKQYPPDIAAKLDNPNLSDADRRSLDDQLNAREYAAYGYLQNIGDGGLSAAKAKIEYYDSMSPTEQNSHRYQGMRDNLIPWVHGMESQQGKPQTDYSVSQDPIVMLFDAIKKSAFKVSGADSKTMLEKYKSVASNLVANDADPTGTAAKVSQASERFTAVQAVIDAARSGDAASLTKLQNLADDPKSITGFLSYAESLSSEQASAPP